MTKVIAGLAIGFYSESGRSRENKTTEKTGEGGVEAGFDRWERMICTDRDVIPSPDRKSDEQNNRGINQRGGNRTPVPLRQKDF